MISKIILPFFVTLLSFNAFSFNDDFKPINGRTSLEFNFLFESLKAESKKPSEQFALIALAKDLNENLMTLQPDHIFLLLKNEVSKGVLEHQFSKIRPVDMNDALVSKVEKSVDAKKEKYSKFSNWIAQSLLAELKIRQDNEIITSASFNPNTFNGEKKLEAERFKRYLKYIYPWIEKLTTDSPADFNQLTKEVSLQIMANVVDRSKLIKKVSPSTVGDASTSVINIPQGLLDLKPDQIKRMLSDEPGSEMTLKELSRKEKIEASEQVDKVTPLDLSTISDDVAKELEDKERKDSPKAP